MRFTPLLQGAAQSGAVGTAASTQAPNTASASGGVVITGAAASVQASNVAAGVGVVGTLVTSGIGASTQAPNVAAASGSTAISGAASSTQAPSAASALGAVVISGAGAATQNANTGAAGGSVMNASVMPSGVIVHFDASAIPAQADNTALATWTDGVGGFAALQATGVNQPKYRTSRAGGRPSVQFAGSQFLSFDGTGTLKTAIDSRTHTVIIAFSNVGTSSNGCLFGSNAGGNSFFMLADGANAGRFDAGTTGNAYPYSSISFAIVGVSSNVAGNYGGLLTGLERDYFNGLPYHSTTSAVPATTAATFGIGAISSTGTFSVKADIQDIYVFNRELTPVEYVQAEIFIRQKNNQSLPWGGLAFLDALDGDSITDDINTGAVADSYPFIVSQQRGRGPGQWACFAIGGINVAESTAKLAEWTGISSIIGIPFKAAYFEWVNSKNSGRSSAQIFADLHTYASTFRVQALSASKLMLGSSTAYGNDATDPYAAVRGVFNGLMDDPTTGALSIADAYTPIHDDPLIGNSTAYANNSAIYFNADTIHLLKPGYAQLAVLMGAGMTALDSSTSSFGVGRAVQASGVAAGVGGVLIAGAADPIQAAASTTAAGGVVVSGTASPTQAAGQAAATGSVVDPGVIVGSGAATNFNSCAAFGVVVDVITGGASIVQAMNVAAAMGLVSVDGVAAATQALATMVGIGSVTTPVTGVGAATSAMGTAYGIGRVEYPGAALQATTGFIASRRQKRIWSTKK